MAPIWNNRLKCRVESISYYFSLRAGIVYVGRGECCDMSGIIALFQDIDPFVYHIETRSGDDPDFVYLLRGDSWTVLEPNGQTVPLQR
jgi:hypothetical protein